MKISLTGNLVETWKDSLEIADPVVKLDLLLRVLDFFGTSKKAHKPACMVVRDYRHNG